MERLVTPLLNELLDLFPCVVLVGPRQCGKTTLLKTLPSPWRHLDMERAADRDLLASDPDSYFRLNPGRLAIDEAQLLPEIFAALRVAIDQDREQVGRFVVSGSSSPALQRNLSESLAGRVAIIEMSPCTFAEVEGTRNDLFLELLATGGVSTEPKTASPEREALLMEYWFEGGYPEPWVKASPRFRKLWKENFVRTYLERDLRPLFPGIDPQRFRTFLGVLASVSGTVINQSDLARALSVSQPTVRDYLEIAHGTFLWRRLLPYHRNVTKRIVKHPYGHLRDTGLLHHLLHIPSSEALMSHIVVGRSWQAMVIEELLRTLESQGIPFEAFCYRTAGGAEVDLILEGDFGLVPIEIKRSSHLTAQELRPIKTFMEEHPCKVGVVIYGGQRTAWIGNKLLALPCTML